ncbi:MAG: CrcB family protein [Rhodococcus sp. (in: high G+C Gram-positive bacteria)]
MTGVWLFLAVCAAGAVGAVARVVLESAVGSRWYDVPIAIPLANIAGSALIGLLAGAALFHGSPGTVTSVAATGFCGGFTTFSTAMVHAVRLIEDGRTRAAAVSVAGTATLSVGACALGLAVMSSVFLS